MEKMRLEGLREEKNYGPSLWRFVQGDDTSMYVHLIIFLNTYHVQQQYRFSGPIYFTKKKLWEIYSTLIL